VVATPVANRSVVSWAPEDVTRTAVEGNDDDLRVRCRPADNLFFHVRPRTKASGWEVVDLPAFDEPPGPLDEGLRLHAVADRTRQAVTMTAAAVCAVGGRLRGVGRMGIRFMPAILRRSR
jgi:hypothetical protein